MALDAGEREAFWRDGFLLRENVIDVQLAARLREHFGELFAGRFPTGIYPDEWHWREGISRPDKFREIVNAWKSSPLVASVALDPALGRLASGLLGWERGARLAQEDVLWKPPGAGGVGYHQDSAYISENFEPRADNSVTVWIALDTADADTGVVEYAVGSHRWPAPKATATSSSFHGAGDELASVRAAAAAAGADLEIRRLSVPCGGAVFHHQDVWHGSGRNSTADRPRRALGVHLLRRDVEFRAMPPPDYIYGRYVLGDGCREVLEQFFPIVWTPEGHSSPIARKLLAAVVCGTGEPGPDEGKEEEGEPATKRAKSANGAMQSWTPVSPPVSQLVGHLVAWL
eukprot:CAMPEP_0168475998 /NCGR_PEP_ID=MMETSP0228-20121227/61659_1 /TAXON_ID=133427 /ORGANISM="Protoceratium reticulatum, Strain CCCM 535 (=CCMP 1889)" /LENGTH=343 /DNA_ID=CAMNT_0008492101 /DNA_START=23 /DNA_END=1052 /DNA_ORIENTATION=-